MWSFKFGKWTTRVQYYLPIIIPRLISPAPSETDSNLTCGSDPDLVQVLVMTGDKLVWSPAASL